MTIMKLLVFLAALLFAAGSARSDENPDITDLPLDSLLKMQISGASKRPQRPADAPSMVSVIYADEIRRFGWLTLGEALSSLRGVHVSYDRSYSYIGVRGFARPGDYNARVLMLIDGVPINDGVYDSAPIGSEFPLDLAVVERIEYVPGAGSVLYGGNAFLAVINVVTVSGAQQKKELELGLGSARASNVRGTLGGREADGTDWLVSATRERRRGRDLSFDAYSAPGANTVSHGLDHEANDRFIGKFARGGFSAGLIVSQRDKGVPGGAYGADLDDPRSRQDDDRVFAHAGYEHHLSTETTIVASGWMSEYSYRGDWSYASALQIDQTENRNWGGEVRAISTAYAHHTLVSGLSWRSDYMRRQFNSYLDSNAPRSSWGAYLQDDWALTGKSTLSMGLRHDRYSSGLEHTSPRLALIARPLPQTVVKLIGSGAFRPPNAYETEYVYAGTNIANPALKPEQIRTLELGLEQYLGPTKSLAASAYHSRITDLIAPETDPATGLQQHHNVGDVVARGLEAEARVMAGRVSVRANVAAQVVTHESGAVLANAPRRLANLLVAAPLARNLSAGWETQYIGPRTADTDKITVAGTAVGGHSVSHLTLSGRATRTLDWQLRLSNVFDRHYGNIVGTEFSAAYPGVMTSPMPQMQQDGRGIFVRLRWRP